MPREQTSRQLSEDLPSSSETTLPLSVQQSIQAIRIEQSNRRDMLFHETPVCPICNSVMREFNCTNEFHEEAGFLTHSEPVISTSNIVSGSISNSGIVARDRNGFRRVTVGNVDRISSEEERNSVRRVRDTLPRSSVRLATNSNPLDEIDYRQFEEQFRQYINRRRPSFSDVVDLSHVENRLTANDFRWMNSQTNTINNRTTTDNVRAATSRMNQLQNTLTVWMDDAEDDDEQI